MKSSADPSERGADEALAVREGVEPRSAMVYQPANAMAFAASRMGNGSGICHPGNLAAHLPNELMRAVDAGHRPGENRATVK